MHVRRDGNGAVRDATLRLVRPRRLPDLSVMKRDWDELARDNAMHYIETSRDQWELDEFFRSGNEDVDAIVVPDLSVICGGRDPQQLRILEIGCGVGRMTKHLATIFGEVHGVDVSGEMVVRGRELLSEIKNARLHETSGTDLALFPDGYFDFAFSYRVFEHIPYRDVILGYIEEAHRVLRPGSLFKFQIHTATWPARLLMSLAPSGGRSSGWRRRTRIGRSDTWWGVRFSASEIDLIARRLGFHVARQERAGRHVFWNWWLRGSSDGERRTSAARDRRWAEDGPAPGS